MRGVHSDVAALSSRRQIESLRCECEQFASLSNSSQYLETVNH